MVVMIYGHALMWHLELIGVILC